MNKLIEYNVIKYLILGKYLIIFRINQYLTISASFYPYGPNARDSALPQVNDVCSGEIDLPLGIPIYGNMKKIVHVLNVLF